VNAPVSTPLELAPAATREGWLRLPVVAVSIAVLVLLAVYWQTTASIVAIWARSDTFVHGFLVVPICIWLAWRERNVVAARTAVPWWPGVAFVLAAGALWFAATMGNVAAVRQFALAFMVIAAIVTIVGASVGRALFFPLAFLLFAVPAGEVFIPTLIDWTANFTVGALRLSGVPVYREGNHFIIPSGAWSVVEACSGVRYLIASTMLGVLFAAITYRSPRRRAMFVAASILVPIIANWLRAYMIVMLGHLTNNKLAAGVDHIIYGWVFFGVVMLGLVVVGMRWREDGEASAPVLQPPAAPARAEHGAVLLAVLVAIGAATMWRPLEALVQQPKTDAQAAVLTALPGNARWQPSEAFVDWKPRYEGQNAELRQTFSAGEAPVGLYIAYYAGQEKGRELVTSTNFLVARDDWRWRQVDQGTARAPWAGEPTSFERATLRGSPVALETWQLYWVAGHVTSSPYFAKMLLAWAKLTARGDDSALIVLYTPATVGDAAERLRGFAQSMSPSIDRMLVTASGGGR
jgi:exosortase A